MRKEIGVTMSEEEEKFERVKFFRLMPQLKTFPKGTMLTTKQDLYYSLEEDIDDDDVDAKAIKQAIEDFK